MKTVKKGILLDMLEQLSGFCEKKSISVPHFMTYDGEYLGGGNYKFNKETENRISLGETWLARYDCARIFYADVTLPADFENEKIYLNLDFGGEILVRINGRLVNSVSSRENGGWVARETVVLNNKDLVFGKPMRLELEACVDSAGFCDAAMAGAKECRYTLKTARFVCIDEICEKFYLDCKNLWDALPVIKDEFINESLYKVLDDSLHTVDFDFSESEIRASIAKASLYFDKRLAEINYTPQAEVLVDGHSHIDIAWLWRVQESERKTARTFVNTLALMDKYPEFTFTQSQAIAYDMIKKNYPDLFERIKEKVKNGQWNIVGNTWVECDTNIASGESMIRQLLYGREFFIENFGVSSDIYWLPDCFGFSWALPQIIKRSGMRYFITTKLLNQDTNRFPHTLFKWQGTDGSEILAYNQRTHYQGEYTPAQIYNAAYNNDLKDVLKTSFTMFGYGDGGSGSTYRMLESAKRLRSFPGLPSSRLAHPQEFFAEAEKIHDELPVYCDELYYENHRGTYTSQSFIKKGNRKNEFLLTRAEMAGCFAGGYDKNAVDELWKLLLKNQFHDILPGTSIHEAMEDCRPDFAKLKKEGTFALETNLQSVNARIGAEFDGIIVWNLTSAPVTAPVTVTTAKTVSGPCRTYIKDGKPVLEFIASAVPPMGYKFFAFANATAEKQVKCENRMLENEFLRVEYDENGILTSVYDKENGRETLAGSGNEISIFLDKCIHETAWNLERNYEKKQWILKDAESIEVTEANAVRAVVKTVRRFNRSVITQNMILYAGSRQLLFETTVDWQERDKVMKAAFNVNVRNTQASFEAAHGAICRPTHRNSPFDEARFEQCAHKWADLSEADYGVSILNDCKYGYDILGSRMRITLMRAPTCPDTKGDLGISTFTYAYYPHAGTWQTGSTVKEAFSLNMPLIGFEKQAAAGTMPALMSFVNCDNEDIIIDTLKAAQNGSGIILRIYQSRAARGKRTLTLNLPFTKITECNLMEEDETEIPVTGNAFTIDVKPFEVRSFRIN